jgi:UTP:GlnB (protein PII) uridylyltransferase
VILAERDRLLADSRLLGRAWCEAWTDAIDKWLVGLYNGVFADQPVCLLVVGGTGRRRWRRVATST